MQEIADDAGINRTLLNYYFRSKDKLFEAVYRKALSSFIPDLASLLRSDISFSDYLSAMIETVIDGMIDNPQVPIFILQELSSNPERVPQIIREMGIDPLKLIGKLKAVKTTDTDVGEDTAPGTGEDTATDTGEVPGMDTGEVPGMVKVTDPRQVIMNILSLCIFPFAARSIVTEILYNGDTDAYLEAMKQRKVLLPALVKQFMT